MKKRTKIKLLLFPTLITLPLIIASCTNNQKKNDPTINELSQQVRILIPNLNQLEINKVTIKDIKLEFDQQQVKASVQSLTKVDDNTLLVKVKITSIKDATDFIFKQQSFSGFKKSSNQVENDRSKKSEDLKSNDSSNKTKDGSNNQINDSSTSNGSKNNNVSKDSSKNKEVTPKQQNELDNQKQKPDETNKNPLVQSNPKPDNSTNQAHKTNQNQPSNPDKNTQPDQPIINPITTGGDQHSLTYDFLKSNNTHQIIQQTNSYKQAVAKMNQFLYHGSNNQPINFRQGYDPNLIKQFQENTRDIGMFGHFGKNDEEKIAFYNDSLSYDGMMKQKYLANFAENEKIGATTHSVDFNDIVSKNPFGYLPSNLSQLFFYMDLKSASGLLKLQDISSLRANFNDKEGTFDLLVSTSDKSRYLLSIDTTNTDTLKKDADFYKYIYDHSFMIKIGRIGYEYNDFFPHLSKLKADHEHGTMWVMDRVINKEAEKEGYYELLVATNIHVFGFRKQFDKSLYFDVNKETEKSKQWNGGFYDSSRSPIVNGVLQVSQDAKRLVHFEATRGETNLPMPNRDIKTDDRGNFFRVFSAYNQYLDGVYYTPRYEVSGIMGKNVTVGEKYFDKYDTVTRYGSTKNAGADFVLLRLKIRKEHLGQILPALAEVVGTEKEKDWHIGVGKDEKFSPIKTQFYGGYPVHVDEYFQPKWDQGSRSFSFKYNKSTGGVVNAMNRFVDENNYQSLWTKYKAEENKDWNSHKEKWKNYEKPFIENEHGMPKNVLVQHSHLYTYAPYDKRQNLLGPGSSGSVAIDSHFNLIGINYLLSKDVNAYANAIALMEGFGDYKNNFDGNLRTDIRNKLMKDKVYTVKINPENKQS
ncbi:MAG2960 family serine endopeptidase lipoprotein [Ureaplasma diversum]|uniref:DUF31 domain-containing protein n=1 Tax=Ureaplasma diversum NCTC 246 TaxID=1188241 RepID=A0A084F062_9BACT|nr:hypothetical protein [Ureaplasma diversum]KEZ23604.1 Hypothetical protein, predicted lipoprotein [Ureaplasma diversum NCTC 246]